MLNRVKARVFSAFKFGISIRTVLTVLTVLMTDAGDLKQRLLKNLERHGPTLAGLGFIVSEAGNI